MARSQRSWQVDWAGPHGTAWGTVNACLTTVTVTVLGHVVQLWWPVPVVFAILGVVVATILGVIGVLLRAAFARKRRPGATVVYQVFCWAGAGGWSAYMVGHPHWTVRWVAARLAALAVMAVVAGLLASLATDPDEDPKPEPAPQPVVVAAPPVDAGQAERDALAVEWEERLDRLCPGEGYQVPNIQKWPRGNGYTVEAVVPAGGGLSWRAIAGQAEALAGDLDLPHGGGLVVGPGVTRRATLIEVTTVDILAEETQYPQDRAVHSIKDDLEVGFRDDGEPIGPNLLQQCMVLAGEAGSGKTNASHCITGEIVTTDDALQWDWELTGGGLWAPWMDPYLRGEIDVPPIDWCAFDGQELLWQTRAALRIGYARKPGYRQEMFAADDDKVPVSKNLPAIIIVGDEIAKVTGALSEHPQAAENLRLIAFELRAAAIREVFLALRGTDDVITQSVQSQCQVRAVMKVGSKAEAQWVFGRHGFGPEDTPYPGCGGISLNSGKDPVRMKWHRMKPSQIRRIAVLAASRRPKLDELSRLAANGRNPDGSPMDDLLPGELDCYDTRWERFRKHNEAGGGSAVPVSTTTRPASGSSAPAPVVPQAGAAPNLTQVVADLDKAMANLDAAVEAANARNAEEQVPASGEADEQVPVDQDGWAAAMAAWEADPFVPAAAAETPPGPPPANWPSRMLDLIESYGDQGVGPKELLAELAAVGIAVHRDTLHEQLNGAIERGEVRRAGRGKYVRRGI